MDLKIFPQGPSAFKFWLTSLLIFFGDLHHNRHPPTYPHNLARTHSYSASTKMFSVLKRGTEPWLTNANSRRRAFLLDKA